MYIDIFKIRQTDIRSFVGLPVIIDKLVDSRAVHNTSNWENSAMHNTTNLAIGNWKTKCGLYPLLQSF